VFLIEVKIYTGPVPEWLSFFGLFEIEFCPTITIKVMTFIAMDFAGYGGL
jgi:hypothetical protein